MKKGVNGVRCGSVKVKKPSLRGLSYTDYGFRNKQEVYRFKSFCRYLKPAELQLLNEIGNESIENKCVVPYLVLSITKQLSYDKLLHYEQIPMCKKDFYANRRKLLGTFRQALLKELKQRK
jgi:hypothetical protein